MKIGIQLYVTTRKAVTIESGEYDTTAECMLELGRATSRLDLEQVKKDLVSRFGDD